jgi:membrane protein required for colicin V production
MNFPPPSLVDIIALAVVAVGGLMGLLRGLSGELARLISTIAALLIGLRYYRPIGEWAVDNTRLMGEGALAMGFVVIIFGVIVVMFLFRFILKRMLQIVIEGGVERIGGLVAGVITASVSVFIFFVILNLMPNTYLNRKFGHESIVGTLVLNAMPHLGELVDHIEASSRDNEEG